MGANAVQRLLRAAVLVLLEESCTKPLTGWHGETTLPKRIVFVMPRQDRQRPSFVSGQILPAHRSAVGTSGQR